MTASNPAAAIQRAREAAELANHRERIAWLSSDRPLWACGTPVDPTTCRILMEQSKLRLRAQA